MANKRSWEDTEPYCILERQERDGLRHGMKAPKAGCTFSLAGRSTCWKCGWNSVENARRCAMIDKYGLALDPATGLKHYKEPKDG